MRPFVARILIVTLAATSIGVILAQAALADCGISTTHFCAYRHSQYGDLILHSAAPAGSNNVDVIDDVTSSGKNGSNNNWCGFSNRPLLPPALIHAWAPNTNIPYVGDADNDQIDFFRVRTDSC
jgi:hypothetical protein